MNVHAAAAALLAYALRGGLLLTVGLLAPRLLALRHPRVLLVYWRVLLFLVLLLPLAPLDWPGAAPLPHITLDALQVEAAVATALPAELPGLSWQLVLAVAVAVTALGLLRLAFGLVYLNRCRRLARPLVPTPTALSDLRSTMGLDAPFMISDRLTVPLTYGWLRPTVLLPESFTRLTAEQQEGVACHELIHVRRKDWPTTLIEELLRAVVWFHPAVWLILPRIALAREQVVDTDTIRLTGRRRPYLDALWSVVCTAPRSAIAPAVPLLGRRDLVDRVVWLKGEHTMSKTRVAVSLGVLAICLAAAGVVGAAVFPDQSLATFAAPGTSRRGTSQSDDAKKADDQLETVSFEGECDEITHPVVIEKINPTYPPEARAERVMGTVVVETVVSENGLVEDIRVLESDDDRFSSSAVSAIEKWRFEPALCDGTPVAVYYVLTVNFRLE